MGQWRGGESFTHDLDPGREKKDGDKWGSLSFGVCADFGLELGVRKGYGGFVNQNNMERNMQVHKSIGTKHGGKIEFGQGSWDDEESSVRLRWDRDDGGFDPISSSEVPLWGLRELVCECAKRDMLPASDALRMIESLVAMLRRQDKCK